MLLLMVVVGLLFALYAQRLREARLQEMIALYREPGTEGILDALGQPIALTYADGATLDDVLKEIKRRTTKNPGLPKIPSGIPIYVDPIGLQEAETNMNAPIRRPPGADALSLGEHLRRILDSLGLVYTVKDDFMMITSEDSRDQTTEVKPDQPLDQPVARERYPYLEYRDVLR